jgi:periplasmic protein TonB
MSLEIHSASGESFGSLSGCLVDGDAEQRTRELRMRRRALAISVALQCALLTALVLLPLFGKTEHIAVANPIPIPPYYPHSSPVQANTAPTPPKNPHANSTCAICPPSRIPPRVPTMNRTPAQEPLPEIGGGDNRGNSQPPWGIGIDDSRRQPARPSEPPVRRPLRIVETHLEPAMLIHRVEPIYPTIPRQMGREGRVELRAIIATDGTIQSLQVVGGDPLFYRSALDAVGQWRYRPTVLNGQAVEIDTQITVIYTMQR